MTALSPAPERRCQAYDVLSQEGPPSLHAPPPGAKRQDEERGEEGGSAQESVHCAYATPKPDISSIFDLGASDEPTDIARDKDKMVGEALRRHRERMSEVIR